ncbi:MAG: hypothetical protein FGF51_05175 [Candidatus Brockarchaeota archaeon]|nr:hypothetical protein [Candidatus Brockarchaeota archaeon]
MPNQRVSARLAPFELNVEPPTMSQCPSPMYLVISKNNSGKYSSAADVLVLQKDLCDEVCLEIEEKFGIPFENVLITAIHTHHAPATATIHGYEKDETFVSNVKHSILSTVSAADENLKSVDVNFWLGIESTVGQNSRLLLSDGTIYWVGPRDDALRQRALLTQTFQSSCLKGEARVLRQLSSATPHIILELDVLKLFPQASTDWLLRSLRKRMAGLCSFSQGPPAQRIILLFRQTR